MTMLLFAQSSVESKVSFGKKLSLGITCTWTS